MRNFISYTNRFDLKAKKKAKHKATEPGTPSTVHRAYRGVSRFRGVLIFTFAFLFSWLPSYGQTTVNYTSDSTMSDAMVANGGVENTNFGSQNQMNVYHQVGQQIPMVFRTFIQYDLSAIPENAIITEAKLKLVTKSVNNAVSHPIYIERVAASTWSEGTITWNNQPDVITAGQLAFSHAQTSTSGTHEFDVTSHVQHMVNNPSLNNGWRIRLQQETASADFGIMYNSSEANNATKRPVLTIEYILPIEMDPSVVHCTNGNNDGTMSVDVSGGSTYGLSNMYFYKTNRDTTQRGKATLQNYKTTGNLAYDAVTGVVTASNLEPGIYILRILDAEYYVGSDLRFAFYKHILVGREGEATSGILLPNYQYQDNVTIQYDKPTNANPLDRANTNYHSNSSLIHLRVADSPNNYEYASLIKYNMDFDDQLLFSKAELQINAYSKFYRNTNSSNAVNFSLVTENWEESSVTWNTRPAIDSLMTVTVPTTTTIGYEQTHKYDTVSIMPFVDHWLANPDENFGFEIALETYGATQYAQRTYKSAGNNINYIQFDFLVREPLVAIFDDTSNTGTLTVNSPSGTLPYKYLIDTKPLSTISDAWSSIDTSLYIDSSYFFTPTTQSKTYSFNSLPSGKYYVGVYDNSGTQIMMDSAIVNTEIDTINATDIDFSEDFELSLKSGTQGSGTSRLYAELLNSEDWGGLSFTINALGEFYGGFNKYSDPVASGASSFEFGLKVAASGAYQIIENNLLLTSSGSISVGDKIDIIREYSDYVVYINDTEVYRDPITSLAGENTGIDFVLADGNVEIGIINYWGKFKKPGISTKVDYPECGASTGNVTVSAESASIITASLSNNDPAGTDPTGTLVSGDYVFEDVPIGTYTLSVSYSVPPTGGFPGYSYVTEEQVAVGYVVAWENKSGNIELSDVEGNFMILPSDPDAGTASANSSNTTVSDYLNWIQFETRVGGIDGEGMEAIYLQNQDEVNAFGLSTVSYLGTASAYDGDEEDFIGTSYGTNGVWRIEQDDDDFEIYHSNVSAYSTTISEVDAPFDLHIYQAGDAAYYNTVASFCNNYPVADQYILPKREIEGGYYLVPEDDSLRFEFYKEYMGNTDLNYSVKDFTGTDQTGLSALTEIYGDNRFLLDVSSLSSGIYIIEIINDKGENWFIRFKVQ